MADRPLSGKNGFVIWPCGCEEKLVRGKSIPAACRKHDKDRFRKDEPWSLELACRLYVDDYGRVFLTDQNGDGNVVYDEDCGDSDFTRMYEVIEQGLEFMLKRGKENDA